MNKNIIYILLIIIVLLTGCKESKHEKFIDALLTHPDEIEQVMENYPMITSSYQIENFQNPTKKQQLIEYLRKNIHQHFSEGYRIKCDKKYIDFYHKNNVKAKFREIMILSKDYRQCLKSVWVYEIGIWKLYELKFIKFCDCSKKPTSP